MFFIDRQFTGFLAGKDNVIKILDEFNIYNQLEITENSFHSFWLFYRWIKETDQRVTNFLD